MASSEGFSLLNTEFLGEGLFAHPLDAANTIYLAFVRPGPGLGRGRITIRGLDFLNSRHCIPNA